MRRFIFGVSLACGLLVTQACAILQTASLTQIPANRKEVVTASVERTIFLAFNFDNDYVDGIQEKLRNQCPGGEIRGVLTKDEVISYVLVHTHRITATGYCVR